VFLKVNRIFSEDDKSQVQKILIQIIDMSDKILYSEAKAEQSFLTLINAAISHELRNPLNSLVG
jgi:signal transduction histidine kinase